MLNIDMVIENLKYNIYGEGKVVVFIPPVGYNGDIWKHQIEELKTRYKVIVIDLYNSDFRNQFTIFSVADSIFALLNRLGIKKATFVGVGISGYIAQKISLMYPDGTDGLVLMSTSYGGANIEPIDQSILKLLFKHVKFNEEFNKQLIEIEASSGDEKLVEELSRYRSSKVNQKIYEEILLELAAFDNKNKISEIRAETLIVCGDDNKLFSKENSLLINDRILHSKIVITSGGYLNFFTHPKKVNNILIKFLDEIY